MRSAKWKRTWEIYAYLTPSRPSLLSKTPSRKLVYINVRIKRMSTRTLLDMGTTHNFISDAEVCRLGLALEKD